MSKNKSQLKTKVSILSTLALASLALPAAPAFIPSAIAQPNGVPVDGAGGRPEPGPLKGSDTQTRQEMTSDLQPTADDTSTRRGWPLLLLALPVGLGIYLMGRRRVVNRIHHAKT